MRALGCFPLLQLLFYYFDLGLSNSFYWIQISVSIGLIDFKP